MHYIEILITEENPGIVFILQQLQSPYFRVGLEGVQRA